MSFMLYCSKMRYITYQKYNELECYTRLSRNPPIVGYENHSCCYVFKRFVYWRSVGLDFHFCISVSSILYYFDMPVK